MNPRVPLTVAFLLALAPSHAVAQQPPKAGDAVEVAITPPTDGADGSLVVVMPKAKLLEAIAKAIPESADVPEQKLGDKLIYRDLRLSKVKATGLKPASLALDGNVFRFAGTPTVTGELNALYEHVVITTEVRTVGKVAGREIKQSVPVSRSDWRPKGAAPFSITADVRGTCAVSFAAGDTLKDLRVRLDTKADFVQIKDVKLTTDDVVYKAAKELIGIAGKAFPNEGVNKPIKDALTCRLDIDPFKDSPAKDRDRLGRYKVKDVAVRTTEGEVRVTAILLPR
jgi:hypothetical protein